MEAWLDPVRFEPVMEEECRMTRNMWCTAGMLHGAGWDIEIAPFTFDPVEVICTDRGHTSWNPAGTGEGRGVEKFRVLDQVGYERFMTDALKRLLGKIQ